MIFELFSQRNAEKRLEQVLSEVCQQLEIKKLDMGREMKLKR